jgi:hypothetical protein
MEATETRGPVAIGGTLTMADGSSVEFCLDPAYGWQQWGATPDVLAQNVYALAAIQEAMMEHWASDDEGVE